MNVLIELLNTSAATAFFTAAAGVFGALAGVVLEHRLRRSGKTICEFIDWTLTATPEGGVGDFGREPYPFTAHPKNLTEKVACNNTFSLRVSFKMFNGRDLPTGLSNPHICFLRGGKVLTCVPLLDTRTDRQTGTGMRMIDTLETINLPSREWVEVGAIGRAIPDKDKLSGFDAVELRAEYPSSRGYLKRMPEKLFIPYENPGSHDE